MREAEIRELWEGYWASWLNRSCPWLEHLPWPVTALVVAAVLYGLGAGYFSIFGGLKLYVLSPHPYLQAAAVLLGLSAHFWSADRVPKAIATASKAIRTDDAALKTAFEDWANSARLRVLTSLIVSIGFVLLYFTHAFVMEAYPQTASILRPWAASRHSIAFLTWYVVFHGGVMGFLMSAGLLGASAWLKLVKTLLGFELRLAYHRSLDALLRHGEALAAWTLIVLVSAVFFADPAVVMAVFGYSMRGEQFWQSIPATSACIALISLFVLCALVIAPEVRIKRSVEAEKELLQIKLRRALDRAFEELRSLAVNQDMSGPGRANTAVATTRATEAREQTRQLAGFGFRSQHLLSLQRLADAVPSWKLGRFRVLRLALPAGVIAALPELLSLWMG